MCAASAVFFLFFLFFLFLGRSVGDGDRCRLVGCFMDDDLHLIRRFFEKFLPQ